MSAKSFRYIDDDHQPYFVVQSDVSTLEIAWPQPGQVKQLIENNGYQAMNEAWAELSDLQRSSRELMRRFDGTIIHEPESEPTLFETNKLIFLSCETDIQLGQSIIYQQQAHEHIRDLHTLMAEPGASLTGYVPDAFTNAYLSVLGPGLQRLDDNELDLEELMKGATLLAVCSKTLPTGPSKRP